MATERGRTTQSAYKLLTPATNSGAGLIVLGETHKAQCGAANNVLAPQMRVEWKAFTFSMAFAKTVAECACVCVCVCADQYALSSSIFTFHTIPPARIRMDSLKASASDSHRTKIELETKAHKTWTSVTRVVAVCCLLFTTIGPQRAARKHK